MRALGRDNEARVKKMKYTAKIVSQSDPLL